MRPRVDTVKGTVSWGATRESGPRRLPAEPCTWCGHTRHAGECPRSITARTSRFDAADVRTPCPCAIGGDHG